MKKYMVIFLLATIVIGCTTEEEPSPNQTDESNLENHSETEDQTAASFRGIDASVKGGVIHLSGQAKVTDDEFFYMVQYGDQSIVEESKVTLDETDDGWGEFHIEESIKDVERKDDEEPIAILYAKNAEGKKVNPNHIPINWFVPY
ncbi:MAG TPA: hypothetical protein VK119_02180 [Bacillota bacterium]|nr:hypothetical protein [Bacillota bacterium]